MLYCCIYKSIYFIFEEFRRFLSTFRVTQTLKGLPRDRCGEIKPGIDLSTRHAWDEYGGLIRSR